MIEHVQASVTQWGARLSRNAPRPSWPSAETRRRAISAALSRSSASRSWLSRTCRTSCLAVDEAIGPALSSRASWRSSASSRRSGSTSWWTRPMRRAVSASKCSPVANQRRAWRGPMASIT
ncbi:hypothetical protein G6F57_019448 [Rhizopus arrhizus]|nr:hypothetical protein G6F56_014315 [Rhizopus delemar]KAG1439360.1 hypothetical protein G6F57_019448 [Rhizopus arrhizus]